jgi:hypothetical protein
LAAISLGWTELNAAILPDDFPEAEALAYMIADNEIGRAADPDHAALARLLDELAAKDPPLLKAAGYDDKRAQKLLDRVNKLEQARAAPPTIPIGMLRLRWSKTRSARFLSIRAWGTHSKSAEVDRLRKIKADPALWPEQISAMAGEICDCLCSTFVCLSNLIVGNPPRGHSRQTDRHFASELAQSIAQRLEAPYGALFAPRALTHTSSPRNYAERGEITLESPLEPGAAILLIDDVATSGTTIEQCIGALAGHLVIPVVWIYSDALEGGAG